MYPRRWFWLLLIAGCTRHNAFDITGSPTNADLAQLDLSGPDLVASGLDLSSGHPAGREDLLAPSGSNDLGSVGNDAAPTLAFAASV